MTHYELLKATKSICETMLANDTCLSDVRMLHVYEVYRQMIAERHKKEYIYQYILEQYGVSRSTMIRINKRMKRQCKP